MSDANEEYVNPSSGFSLADVLGGGDDPQALIVEAMVRSTARFDGAGLRAMLFVEQYDPALAARLNEYASRRGNFKRLAEALKFMSLYEKLRNINIAGGGGK